jgi:hypothetical protein|tara:strand:+ start:542 stop:973 length:432 start_codon:yes stop_codon:yes gene_type:complete
MTDYLKIIRDTEKWFESRGESIPNYLSGKQTKTPESVFSITNNIKDKPMAKVTAVQVLKEAAELKERKSKDYQGGMWSEEDYFPFGDKSYVHMIHTKYLRMRNIVEGDQETNFEALEDTLIDMAVYCAMFAAYLENIKMERDN